MKKFWLIGIFFFATSMLYADSRDKLIFALGAGNADYTKGAFNDDETLETLSFGYQYSDFYSLELSYIDLGRVTDRYFPSNVVTISPDVLTLESKGLTIAPKFDFSLSNNWSVSTRIGLSILDTDKQWAGGTVLEDFYLDDTGGTETKFFYGFGLKYDIDDSMSFELNWDNYEVESVDVDAVYAKLNFYF